MASAQFADDRAFGGLRTIRLANQHLRLAVLPELAGKIVELIDVHSGRNWLWSNPNLGLRLPTYGAPYGAVLDSGGWDEVLLSIAPQLIHFLNGSRAEIPDHGDLVGQSWELTEGGIDNVGNACCELIARGRAMNYGWRRRIELDASRPIVRIDYELQNDDVCALPLFWCAHPLIAMQPGMRIRLTPGLPFRIIDAHGLESPYDDQEMSWPWLRDRAGNTIDLTRCFDSSDSASGFALKLFVRSSPTTHIAIESSDGLEQFHMRYDARQVPWLGLWINNRGWTGTSGRPYFNLGIEPSMAPTDSLDQAIARGEVAQLQPGERRHWNLEVRLGSGEFLSDAESVIG